MSEDCVLEFVKNLLGEAVNLKITEIYFQPQSGAGLIRYRRDHRIQYAFSPIQLEIYDQICRCLCTIGNVEPSKLRRRLIETVIKVRADDRNFDFFFVGFPGLPSPSIALQLLS